MNEPGCQDFGRLARWATIGCCAIALIGHAGEPARSASVQTLSEQAQSAPADTRVESVGAEPEDPPVGFATGHRRGPTEEQWREAVEALKESSPRRLEALQQIHEEPARQRLRAVIYSRYLTLKRVKENFPKLYEVQLERIKIEDNLFDIHRRFVVAPPSVKMKLRAELRQQVQLLFDNTQKDRQTRIDRFKDWTAELESKKADDDRDKQSVIDWQLQQVITHGPASIERGGGRKDRLASPGTYQSTQPTPTHSEQ